MWPELQSMYHPGSFIAHKIKNTWNEHEKSKGRFWTCLTATKHKSKKKPTKLKKVEEHRRQNFVSIIQLAKEFYLV